MSEYEGVTGKSINSLGFMFGDFTDEEVTVYSDWTQGERRGVEFSHEASFSVENFTSNDGRVTQVITARTGLPQESNKASSCVIEPNSSLADIHCENKIDDNSNSIIENDTLTNDLENLRIAEANCTDCDTNVEETTSNTSELAGEVLTGNNSQDSQHEGEAGVANHSEENQNPSQIELTELNKTKQQTKPKPPSWADLFKSGNKQETVTNTSRCTKIPEQNPDVVRTKPDELHFAHKHLETSKQFIPIEKDSRLSRLVSFVENFKFVNTREPYVMRGLINRGNWCYINATLQVLISTPPFCHLFRAADVFINNDSNKSAIPLIDCMALFINKFKGQEGQSNPDKKNKEDRSGVPFVPKEVYDILPSLKCSLSEKGRQEDAEEFLSFLLNGLHDEFSAIKMASSSQNFIASNANHSNALENGDVDINEEDWEHVGPKNKSAVMRKAACKDSLVRCIFGGCIRSSVHRSGTKESASLQPFFTLQLDIQSDGIHNVKDALELYFDRKDLQGFTCSKTNAEVEAFHKSSLEELPWILILHLKYFVFDKTGGSQKLHKAIDICPDLEIPRDVLSSSIKSKIPAHHRRYKLLGVVYHHGKNSAGGHYTAAIKRGISEGWFLCDDDVIKPIHVADVIKHQQDRVPYLLMYEKTIKGNVQ